MINKIVDCAIDKGTFSDLQRAFLGHDTPWIYSPVVDGVNDPIGYYTHNIYMHDSPCSHLYDFVLPRISDLLIDLKSLLRIRLISFCRTHEIHQFGQHQDYPFDHCGMLLYINTNNGYTRLENGDKVMSKENRVFYHNPSHLHNSTSCTDAERRVVLTVNYL